MPKKEFERRLAAVMIADVVGYSRLTHLDEDHTRLGLQGHRFAVIDPTIGQYRGRIVNFSGDSLLVEFLSVTDAVECGVAIQNRIMERNSQVAEDKKIRFRIGIHLGDVLIDGDQIFGDGINIAARLEALAEPDGVCISSAVYAQISGFVEHTFTDLGAHHFKNIKTPVRVYHHSGSSAASLEKSAFRPFVDLPTIKQTVETGGCMCGAVRYETSEPDLGTMLCHCRMCQKFSGAPILAGTTFRTKSVKFTSGTPKYYTSSAIAKRGFCGKCGTALIYKRTVGQWTEWVMIFTATLDHPEPHVPSYHLGVESALPWLQVLDEMPRTRCEDSPSLIKAYDAVKRSSP
jgi:adenylate cyclase